MGYKVLKFGGSILKDRKDFVRVADIVAGELASENVPVPVVSAVKGVTDRIVEAVEGLRDGDGVDTGLFVKNLFKEHIDALPDSDNPPPALMEEFENLEHVLGYVKTSGELNDSAYIQGGTILQPYPLGAPILEGDEEQLLLRGRPPGHR